VAFLNSSTLRKDLPAGPIRLLDVHEILPFANMLVTWELTGEEIMTIVQQNASAMANDRAGGLQVSGLRYGYRRVGDHVEVEGVAIGGRPLSREKVYTAAAPDYVVTKAERYFNLPNPEVTELGVGLTEAIADAVKASGPIHAEIDRRMQALRDSQK
jgi:2',3'-cyclic-nucleotide 2'-phosphodiesterase (5'-nucleotidase family)